MYEKRITLNCIPARARPAIVMISDFTLGILDQKHF